MIAYDHYIKFIPELKHDEKVEGSFTDTIIVKESISNDLEEKLKFELTFFNNQSRDLTLCTDREFARTQEGQVWAFEVKNVVTFFWHSGTLSLEYIKYENFTEKLLEYWCLHIVLPIFFNVEEIYNFLHAGAVELDGKPVLFVAESFGGKSTMIDFFMKQGHTAVSDDKVATYEKDGQFFAVPSHPHHRPYREMEDLGFFIENFATESKPIHAVYELEKADKDADIRITELTGIEKFKTLRFSSEINLSFLKVECFTLLTNFTRQVPVFKIYVPWDIERLSEVHDEICQHSKKLP